MFFLPCHLHPGQTSRGLCNHLPAWQGGGVFPPAAGAAGSVKGLDGEDHPPWQRQRSQRWPWVRESPGYSPWRIWGLRWTEQECLVSDVTRTSLLCKLPVGGYDICCAPLVLLTIVTNEFRSLIGPSQFPFRSHLGSLWSVLISLHLEHGSVSQLLGEETKGLGPSEFPLVHVMVMIFGPQNSYQLAPDRFFRRWVLVCSFGRLRWPFQWLEHMIYHSASPRNTCMSCIESNLPTTEASTRVVRVAHLVGEFAGRVISWTHFLVGETNGWDMFRWSFVQMEGHEAWECHMFQLQLHRICFVVSTGD